jgi:hypothetical protein
VANCRFQDHRIETAHGLALLFECGPKLPVLPRRIGVLGRDRYPQEKFFDDGPQTRSFQFPRTA